MDVSKFGEGATTPYQLSQLRQRLVDHFNQEELQQLCFDLGVRSDDLAGQTISAKAQSLLEHLAHRGRVPALIELVKQLRPDIDWDVLPADLEAEPPFKGLQYFIEEDAHLFFGREALTRELVEHLYQHRFLAVVGASGSGKSSVVRAGLVPAVRRGEVAYNERRSDSWPIHVMTPGDSPLKALAASLTQGMESVTAMKTLLEDMRGDSESLDLWLYRQMVAQETRLLLQGFSVFQNWPVVAAKSFSRSRVTCKMRL